MRETPSLGPFASPPPRVRDLTNRLADSIRARARPSLNSRFATSRARSTASLYKMKTQAGKRRTREFCHLRTSRGLTKCPCSFFQQAPAPRTAVRADKLGQNSFPNAAAFVYSLTMMIPDTRGCCQEIFFPRWRANFEFQSLFFSKSSKALLTRLAVFKGDSANLFTVSLQLDVLNHK